MLVNNRSSSQRAQSVYLKKLSINFGRCKFVKIVTTLRDKMFVAEIIRKYWLTC